MRIDSFNLKLVGLDATGHVHTKNLALYNLRVPYVTLLPLSPSKKSLVFSH